jgi:hypothetical protein
MLYFPGVTAACFAVLWLVNLNDDRATLPLCLAISVAAGALAWLGVTLSNARDRRRRCREQSRAEQVEAGRRLTERLGSAMSA